MDNSGNKLMREILKEYEFEKEVILNRSGDEIKWWYRDGISIHEDSWWEKDGKSLYSEEEKCPEVTFAFATYIKGDGGFKGGFVISTDAQLKNLYFSLTNTLLIKQHKEENK